MITIARLTILECYRRRIIWLLAALTAVSVGLVALGVGQLVSNARADGMNELALRIGISQVLILIAFMFSFVLAMTAAFLAAPAVGGDIESGLALALLARPLRRSELMLGRWLGLAVVVVGYTVLSGALAIAVVSALAGFGPPHPVLALAFLSGQALVLMTLTLALGTVLPAIGAGAIVVLAFGVAWMAGVMSSVATAFELDTVARLAEVTRWLFPSDGLWRGVIYGLEPPAAALLAAGRSETALEANPFFTLTPPSLVFVVWSVCWIALVLAIAGRRLGRRDL
jgi:ABC-type transport system involved in multi-copper enzyme maturation permease subunit